MWLLNSAKESEKINSSEEKIRKNIQYTKEPIYNI
jgi:hypothetical protein